MGLDIWFITWSSHSTLKDPRRGTEGLHLWATVGIAQGVCQKADVRISIPYWGFPGGSVVKNPPANAGDKGSIPGSGRSLREGNGNSLQYSCLKSSIDRGTQQATYSPLGHKESDMTECTHRHTWDPQDPGLGHWFLTADSDAHQSLHRAVASKVGNQGNLDLRREP